MNDIKPIETWYNGYKFRSRTEARWAVFFDALNIAYQYELEGYDLGDMGYYLPDFYLPDFGMFVEIKPFDKSVVKFVGDGNKWELKCSRFRDVVNRAILLCYGTPDTAVYSRFFGFYVAADCGSIYESNAFFISHPYSDDAILFVFNESMDDSEYPGVFFEEQTGEIIQNRNVMNESQFCHAFTPEVHNYIAHALQDCYLIYNPVFNSRMTKAKTAARSARFEHGESGAVT